MSSPYELQKLKAENEALTKRVAELESELRIAWEDDPAVNEHQLEVAVLKDNIGIARKVIDDLKAQLAWTPVAQGLPTEPGWYVFHSKDEGTELVYGADTGPYSLWVGSDKTYDPEGISAFTVFRRITLPEAT